MFDYPLLLVKSDALPPVYKNVVIVKEMLACGKAANVSEAIRKVGISRSAYYKYKDSVFGYNENSQNNKLSLSVVLSDSAGNLSALTARLYKAGVNIVTVNQHTPVDGAAVVSITVTTDNMCISVADLLEKIKKVNGVISVKIV